MFVALSKFVLKGWWAIIVFWLALFAGLYTLSPDWEKVVTNGEFAFMTEEADSRVASKILDESFPNSDYGSSLLFLVAREDEELRNSDLEFLDQQLLPSAQSVGEKLDASGSAGKSTASISDANVNEAKQQAGKAVNETSPQVSAGASESDENEFPDEKKETDSSGLPQGDAAPVDPENRAMVMGALSPVMPIVGELLQSKDRHVAIALVQISEEFLHEKTWQYVTDLETELNRLRAENRVPEGLDVYLSGSAVLGRDITLYRSNSASWIQSYSGWLIVLLLLIVFRAPLITLIPLLTLSIAVQISMYVLAFLADAGVVTIFDGIEVYLTVIAYGAGVDYSMFLISRYEEELLRHDTVEDAIDVSIKQTGNAIAASACTEILGIAMLIFAAFGKLSQSGVAISISLGIMLIASLTLTPSLLRAGRRFAFWPRSPKFQPPEHRKENETKTYRLWHWIGLKVTKRPNVFLAIGVCVLLAPTVFACFRYNTLSYGLVAELPKSSTTVQSISKLQDHLPLGTIAPITVLVKNDDVNFNTPRSERLLREWSDRLVSKKEDLHLADVQNFANPLGTNLSVPDMSVSPTIDFVSDEFMSFQAARYYVSNSGPNENHVTRARLILSIDPFTKDAISLIEQLKVELFELLPPELQDGTTIHFAGPTASLRSMQTVAQGDQKLLFSLITIAVLFVLVLILRDFLIAIYLVLTVGITFLVTFGVTWLVFRIAVGPEFIGLDWSVPLLLFTLLMAVGADYNVLLVTRAYEETERHGVERGLVQAIATTGSVITGCGIVMAGTFATLLIGGELLSMRQLGFALAFGVLLDTFIIRTLLVPSFLLLIGRWREKRNRSAIQAKRIKANQNDELSSAD
jgi:RND superfamily putative drug exporter